MRFHLIQIKLHNCNLFCFHSEFKIELKIFFLNAGPDIVKFVFILFLIQAYCSILYLKPKMHIILQGKKVQTQFVTKTLANVFKDTYKPVCRPPLVSLCQILEQLNV